jgi:galactokinase
VIVNSGVKHSLASSAYNDRRRECEAALADINKVKKASSLCALSVDEFERYKDSIINPVCRKRAKHAVYENHRTKQAADALRNGGLTEFGRLMRESHLSLKDDYEVSCAELDFLAEAAWSFDGVYGARMTGGGFGGCTVNLIKKDRLSSFVGTVSEKYRKEFGIDAQIFAVEISGGARVISD